MLIIFSFYPTVCKSSYYTHLYMTWHTDAVSLQAEILLIWVDYGIFSSLILLIKILSLAKHFVVLTQAVEKHLRMIAWQTDINPA